jgi:AraC family transcriptional regulator
VIEVIDQQLDQPLNLEYLSNVAHFSPFHFHRLFNAWTGETLGDYLRRRRVEVGAMRLAGQPSLSVLTAALSVGFGSGEAFTRAFSARFGCSLTTWRNQPKEMLQLRNLEQFDSNFSQASPLINLETRHSSIYTKEFPMKVTIINRAATPIAYLRHTGPYGVELSQFWQSTYYKWAESHGLLNHARYGISHDDPSITAPERCRYDACVEVAEDFIPSGQALKTILPGGKYAVLNYEGTAATMVNGWNYLLREWLPSSGMQLDARPSFEHYPIDSTYNPVTGVMSCHICIPVVAL